jgi:hypothetical protein
MLANTYWFIQTSKKGFLYDCSCESCPCSFSSVFFFDNKSSKDPVPNLCWSRNHICTSGHIMKRSMPGQKLRQFFLFTHQNDRKNPGFYNLHVHLYFAHGKIVCGLRDSDFPINPYQITRLQCKLPSIFVSAKQIYMLSQTWPYRTVSLAIQRRAYII